MSFGKTGYRDGGNRGGHDRFQWQDVKEDKYRENYLGHSIRAPVGRWQKNKDLFWFNKVGDREEARKAEMEEIRRRDEDLINQALGLAPKQHAVVESNLAPEELKQLLAKGTSERDRLDVERVEGLGAAPAARHEHIPKMSLVERELERMKKAQAEGKEFAYEDGALEDVPESGEGGGKKQRLHDESDSDSDDGGKMNKKAKKAEKKRKKEEKKEKKKDKKRMKKEAKEKEASREGEERKDDDHDDRGRRRRATPSPSPPRRRRHDSPSPKRRSRSRSRGGRDDRGRDRDRSRERRR